MTDPAEPRLSAAQREYDELEDALLVRLPEFRLYLTIQNYQDRQRYEPALACPEFLRWQQLAVEISNLHEEQGEY